MVTNNPENAKWYANVSARQLEEAGQGGAPQLVESKITLKNPYVVRARDVADEGESAIPDLATLRKQGYDGVVVPQAEWGPEAFAYGADPNIAPKVKYVHYAIFDPKQAQILGKKSLPPRKP